MKQDFPPCFGKELRTDGLWITALGEAVASLTPQQAAWKPAPSRHSIWQIVNHVCIWREFTLTKFDGRPGPAREQMDSQNFVLPSDVKAPAWDAAVARLRKSHDEIRAAIASKTQSEARERLFYHLGHDCYHLGQIMYLRALQGLAHIE